MKKPLKILCYILGAFLSVGIIALMVYQTRDSFVKIWQGVSTRYLFLSLLSSVLIYISMGLSLYEVLRIMGRRVSKGAAIGIALVSTTVNYVVSSLGVSGFALRAHLLNRRRVPFGMCVTASIVITVLLYFVLAVIITPIIKFFNDNQGFNLEYQEYEINQNLINYIQTNKIEAMENNIVSDLEDEGLLNIDILINYSLDNNELSINSCTINLENLVISSDKQHINKYEIIKQIVRENTNLTDEEMIFYE